MKKKIIGLSITSAGFTGMLPSSELKGLPSGIVTESPTIDEILVHISKGGPTYE
jgi:ABC-2 type transport system ATP-binding protein